MLNYLGPSIGPQGPVTNVLPPAQPGTMPSGVPGVRSGPPAPPPMPSGAPRPSLAAGPSPVMQRNVTPPAGILAAILHHAASGAGGPPAQQPPHPKYVTTTQEDGSILLHVKGPHGPGPVVKIIPPIKRGNAGPATP